MQIRPITQEEKLQLDLVQTIAFVGTADVEEMKKRALEQPDDEYRWCWGCFDEENRLTAGMIVNPYQIYYDGHTVKMGGIGGVASLPEHRMQGGIRSIFQALFQQMRRDQVLFSILYPFSHRYYRQFGYEVCHVARESTLPVSALKRFKQTGKAYMYQPGQSDADFREVYGQYAKRYNEAVCREDWVWSRMLKGDAYKDRNYRYVLTNDGRPTAYVMFRPEEGEDHERILAVYDLAFVSVEAFHDLLGFLYRLSAQYPKLRMELPEEVNLAALMEEPYDLTIREQCYTMARVLDVRRALELMRHPEGVGSYTLAVEDAFLTENTGGYRVQFGLDGVRVEPFEGEAELSLSITSFTQLCLGYLSLDSARFKPDVCLRGNGELLRRVFHKKPVFLSDRF